jgi:endonuclease YncB( thermonuclease family)
MLTSLKTFGKAVCCCGCIESGSAITPKELRDNALLNIDMDAKQINVNLLYLNNILYKDTTPFVPPIQYGKVIKVYDGDTITIASLLPNTTEPVYRFTVRLGGIDSAEIKGKTEIEKMLAIDARDALYHLIFGKIVHLKNTTTEKYGRILADVYCDGIFVNKWMLDNKLAVPYNGGTKIRPDAWNSEA